MRARICSILGLFGTILSPTVPAAAETPNVVLIVADDLGYGDLGSYGARNVETPHLDRLAREGVRFTQAYSASPVCSPSRAALLTGRYPIRTGVTRVFTPRAAKGLPPRELTLAELLRRQGYRTGIVGKWHLGSRKPYLPLQQGFDEYFGMPYSNDMKPLRYLEGNEVVRGDIPSSALLTRRYTERAVEFIRSHAEERFFLYMPHSMPHYPIDAGADWKGTSRDGIYGDVIQELDWSVGELLRALRQAGIEDRTAIFFTSDNGSWRRASNGGLRGKKGSTWEGGMRVPLLIRYPDRVEGGRRVEEPVMGFDLFTTIVSLAGARLPRDRPIDGVDLLPLLADGGETSRFRQRPVLYYWREIPQAIRRGRWKLHRARRNLLGKSRPLMVELYDLESDPGESVDLAESHPEVAEELSRELDRMSEQLAGSRLRAGS